MIDRTSEILSQIRLSEQNLKLVISDLQKELEEVKKILYIYTGIKK